MEKGSYVTSQKAQLDEDEDEGTLRKLPEADDSDNDDGTQP